MGANIGVQKKQLDTQNQLQQQQLAQQNETLAPIKSALQPYLSGNQGFTAPQQAALNSQALDQNALRYNQGTQQANAMLAARGENGLTPGSGIQAGAYGALQAGKAGDLADSLRTVTLNNAQQGLANQFNASSVLSGNAQTLAGNVGTFGSGASNALNQYGQAQQNGLGRAFVGALAQGLGSGVSAFATGGLGSLGSTWGKSLGGGKG